VAVVLCPNPRFPDSPDLTCPPTSLFPTPQTSLPSCRTLTRFSSFPSRTLLPYSSIIAPESLPTYYEGLIESGFCVPPGQVGCSRKVLKVGVGAGSMMRKQGTEAKEGSGEEGRGGARQAGKALCLQEEGCVRR